MGMRLLRPTVIRLLAPIVVVAAWWILTDWLGVFPSVMLPSPLEVLASAVSLATDGNLFSGGLYEANLAGHILISLRRVFLAWLAAVGLALPIGLLIASVPTFERYTSLSIQLLSQIPPIAYVPLAIIWFGLGEEPILFIIFVGAFWAMLINVSTGARNVPPILLRAARSQGASTVQIFWRVLLPASLPFIFVGLRISFGVAWVAIVAAELVASSSGLGYLIMHARRIFASADIIVGMACIAILGVLFDALFRAAERRICPWR